VFFLLLSIRVLLHPAISPFCPPPPHKPQPFIPPLDLPHMRQMTLSFIQFPVPQSFAFPHGLCFFSSLYLMEGGGTAKSIPTNGPQFSKEEGREGERQILGLRNSSGKKM
jgi:hypothetical protein